jgi:hypothetical protein
MVSGLSALGFGPTRPRPASLFAYWLPLYSQTAIPIPFLFNHSSTLRLRCHPTARHLSLLISLYCGLFPSQRTGYTPLPRAFFAKGPFFFTQLAPSFEGSVLREGLTQLAPSFEGSVFREGLSPHLHGVPIPFSRFQKSRRLGRFDPAKRLHLILRGSRVPSHESRATLRSGMYPVPCFSIASDPQARKRHTGIILREAL